MNNKLKILLNIQELDSSFLKLVETTNKYATINIAYDNNFSLENYDIFIGKKLEANKLEKANKLKYILAYKTGVDDFPLNDLEKRNIILINSHADANIIAEYAFGLAISLVNRINEFDFNLRKGIWYDSHNIYWRSFFKMKVGLFGYGHIGKEIHKLLLTNNIESYTINRNHSYQNIKLVNNLKELVNTCDIIILSVPKTKETDNLFNKEIFELMKDKFLVNVGRSNVINQKDLYDYLKNNYLAGAAIDTWDKKPINKTNKLMPSKYPFEELDNIILSPHAAMRVNDGHARYVEDITNILLDIINNKPLRNIINYKKGY